MQETEFPWENEGFGASHRGRPGAVLADGTEPKAAIFDLGSGTHFHETSDWWVYDGDTPLAPHATALRGACSCGWRGSTLHPVDWQQVAAEGPDDYDTQGPHADWTWHIADVEHRAVPIPHDAAALSDQLRQRLDALASDAPLAALRLVAVLESSIAEAGAVAARIARADDQPWDTIATALGVTNSEARTRLHRYARHY
ncbi:hypothetical protein ACIQZN_31625 [Streptomyces sp. NPDC097595]|uniref:hypothetical protein n=1 Tax=Streptomyces sp. NPDC097595 TaxID=3366090 RepID=UPI003829B50A